MLTARARAGAAGRLAATVVLLLADIAVARSLSDVLGVSQPGFVTITPAILELQRALVDLTRAPGGRPA